MVEAISVTIEAFVWHCTVESRAILALDRPGFCSVIAASTQRILAAPEKSKKVAQTTSWCEKIPHFRILSVLFVLPSDKQLPNNLIEGVSAFPHVELCRGFPHHQQFKIQDPLWLSD